MDDLDRAFRQKAREYGKRGGRPRTVFHDETKGCRCVECKVKKGWVKPRVQIGGFRLVGPDQESGI